MLAGALLAATPVALASDFQHKEIQLTAGAADAAQDLLQAITFLGGDLNFDVVQPAAFRTLDLAHNSMWSAINGIPPYGDGTPRLDEPMLSAINFISSPLSGVLIGALGPALSPLVELANSLGTAFASLGDGDFGQALQDLLATPGNVVNAFVEGTTLDLSWLLPLIRESGLLPLGALSGLEITLGGWSTEGVTIGDPADFDPADPENLGTGGSIFNALTFTYPSFPGDGVGDIVGQAVGPMAALEGLWDVVSSTFASGAAG